MTLADKNQKIEKKVVSTYKNIEDTVVNGYKKMEKCAVESFSKVSDSFIDKLFRRTGETIEETKARLKN